MPLVYKHILKEDGGFLLLENGFKFHLEIPVEEAAPAVPLEIGGGGPKYKGIMRGPVPQSDIYERIYDEEEVIVVL